MDTDCMCESISTQSNEVGGSSYMEKEGLIRSLDLLLGSGVKLDCIITGRHPQIKKFLRDRKITHYYDVWHVAKGVLPCRNILLYIIKTLITEHICEVVIKTFA